MSCVANVSCRTLILNSDKAIQMNIAIMRAFVEVRRILLQQTDIKEQIKLLKERIGEHDTQLSQIYDALEKIKRLNVNGTREIVSVLRNRFDNYNRKDSYNF